MKIAFISTRGIPNNYGGFEQFAEYISVGLAQRGHEVTVYSPNFHPYKGNNYKGVRIKHIYSPETWMGSSVGSFFYDFSSLKDALKNGMRTSTSSTRPVIRASYLPTSGLT